MYFVISSINVHFCPCADGLDCWLGLQGRQCVHVNNRAAVFSCDLLMFLHLRVLKRGNGSWLWAEGRGLCGWESSEIVMGLLNWDPKLLLPSLTAAKSVFCSVFPALRCPKCTFVQNTTSLNKNLQVEIDTRITSKAGSTERGQRWQRGEYTLQIPCPEGVMFILSSHQAEQRHQSCVRELLLSLHHPLNSSN